MGTSSGPRRDWAVDARKWMLLAITWVLIPGVSGHGRLLDPPSRSSMWRLGFTNPVNYDDNQLFCGGFQLQWQQYGGKCGLCGDPWPGPRDNEPGGRFANGVITKKYQEGEVIEVYVELTANHKGYFEFRLCKHDRPLTNITQECLDEHVLVLDDSGQTRFLVPAGAYSTKLDIKLKLRLPRGVICAACVLQWKYNAGNSWGTDPVTGQAGIGFGAQEQFYGCADVAIGHADVVVGEVPEKYPWYFQKPDSEWHYGIAYVFGSRADRGSINGAVGVETGKTVYILVLAGVIPALLALM